MPSAASLAVDLSTVTLVKLHSMLRHLAIRKAGVERARGILERDGNCPPRDMGRGPEAKALLGDSRRKGPLLRAPRTPRVVS